MKYRKKPIIVDAFKWTGGPDQTEDPEWIEGAIKKGDVFFKNSGTLEVTMHLDQGAQIADRGDYIVMDEYGAMSAHSPEGFEATYEKVEDNV